MISTGDAQCAMAGEETVYGVSMCVYSAHGAVTRTLRVHGVKGLLACSGLKFALRHKSHFTARMHCLAACALFCMCTYT